MQKTLDLKDARTLIEGARAKAIEIGIPMCIAVVDAGANLVAFERMDGGKVTSITLAIDKAFTAAGARKATHDYGKSSQPGSPTHGINSTIGGRLLVVGGGLPVYNGEECIGGIGVSSGTPAQDLECAESGIKNFVADGDLGT